jgi:uncharacterized protein (DUF4415 family)
MFVGSYRRDERGEMKERNTTSISRDDPRKGKSDIEKLRKLTDAEINASIAGDPDWDIDEADWSDAVLVIPPKKKAISIRVDEDVLDYFKQHGTGYQRRINAVLRSYMEQTSDAKRRKKRA